jgi:hypothetical protein
MGKGAVGSLVVSGGKNTTLRPRVPWLICALGKSP